MAHAHANANRNQTALITGASSGIGRELSERFARDRYRLVLVARSRESLEQLAEELAAKYGTDAEVLAADLSEAGAADRVFAQVQALSLSVDVLVNNAGAGQSGFFHEIDAAEDERMIQLNLANLTRLTKLAARQMTARGSGKILNVASIGAYMPGPMIAVYYAAKAYVLSFSLAVAAELKPFGIAVTALCPGPTRTRFSQRAGRKEPKYAMSAARVAEAGYRGLFAGKAVVVPGAGNRLLILLSRILTGRFMADRVRRVQAGLLNGKSARK